MDKSLLYSFEGWFLSFRAFRFLRHLLEHCAGLNHMTSDFVARVCALFSRHFEALILLQQFLLLKNLSTLLATKEVTLQGQHPFYNQPHGYTLFLISHALLKLAFLLLNYLFINKIHFFSLNS